MDSYMGSRSWIHKVEFIVDVFDGVIHGGFIHGLMYGFVMYSQWTRTAQFIVNYIID